MWRKLGVLFLSLSIIVGSSLTVNAQEQYIGISMCTEYNIDSIADDFNKTYNYYITSWQNSGLTFEQRQNAENNVHLLHALYDNGFFATRTAVLSAAAMFGEVSGWQKITYAYYYKNSTGKGIMCKTADEVIYVMEWEGNTFTAFYDSLGQNYLPYREFCYSGIYTIDQVGGTYKYYLSFHPEMAPVNRYEIPGADLTKTSQIVGIDIPAGSYLVNTNNTSLNASILNSLGEVKYILSYAGYDNRVITLEVGDTLLYPTVGVYWLLQQ